MMFEDVVAGVWALEETKVCLPIPPERVFIGFDDTTYTNWSNWFAGS
jgi:hypothetical protein